MLNIKKLLTKICTELSSLLSWKSTDETKVEQIGHRGEYYHVAIDKTGVPGPSSVSVSNTTYTNILHVTVPAGRWIFYGQVDWEANATGRRYIYIGSNSAASNTWRKSQMTNASGTTRQNLMVQAQYDSPNTIYLVGYQSSGAKLTVSNAEFIAARLL